MMTPKLSYIICSLPRSGTHLLGEALQNTGIAGKPDEYFICDSNGHLQNEEGHIAELYGKKTLEEFRQLVFEFASTPNGTFGVTIMASYLDQLLKNYRQLPQYQGLRDYDLINKLFYEPKYIWLVRQDKVKQAISLVKAQQTRIWGKPKGQNISPNQTPIFDYRTLEYTRLRLLDMEARWASYFQENDIEPFKVTYEALVNNYEQTALNILAFLNIPTPKTVTFRKRRLQKQANKLSEEWEARYYRIHQSRYPQLTLLGYKIHAHLGKITVRRWIRTLLQS